MNISIFITMLLSLQFSYWIIGKRASKKLYNKKGYFLAGKNVQFFPLMMTFFATQVGGGVFLGAADEAYRYGWIVFFYPLGVALGLMVLGLGIGRRLAKFQISTVAEIFEVSYQSTLLRKIASILSMTSLFMILIAQIIASQKFLESMGIQSIPLFILFWVIVIIYTTQGGLKAVISTDTLQALLFSAVFLFAFIMVFSSFSSASQFQPINLESFKCVSSKITGWLLMPLLFMLIEQDMGQRCFAGDSPKVISRAAFLSGVCTLLICIIPVFFGCLAGSMRLEIPKNESVLMTVIAKTTSPWLTALVGCAILAAIISTATSLINAIASNLSGDFKMPYLKKIESMRLAKGLSAFISVGALISAFYFNDIVGFLIQSYELSVSCLFVPIFIALFKRNGNALSAFSSVVFGAIGFFLFRIYPTEFPKELLNLGCSFLGYICGEATVYRNKILVYLFPSS